MPYDHDLYKFMKSVEDLVRHLADPTESVDHSHRKERVKNALKEAYLAGYAQCEQDYHDHCGL